MIPKIKDITLKNILKTAKPLAAETGVYFVVYKGELVYIGQSTNIYSRVTSHEKLREHGITSPTMCYLPIEEISLETSLRTVESRLIRKLKPKWNIVHSRNSNRRQKDRGSRRYT